MRIDGLAITFCLGLGVADLLTINLVLSPRLAGEPTLAPAALALAVAPEPSDKARIAEPPVAPAEVAARPAAETPPTLVAVQPSAPTAAAPTPQPTVTEVPTSEARTEAETGPLAIIYFEKSLARLDTASRARLDQLAADLRRHPRWKIHVSGHTDPTGPDEWNRRLSVIRARVVAARLERAGIDEQRIETEGRAALDANGPAETCRRAQVAMLRGDE